MGVPDFFALMAIPIPRVGVITKDERCKQASAILDRETVSVFEIPNSAEAIRIINGETKKGAMVILTSDTTPGLEDVVAKFRGSNRVQVFKIMVITSDAKDYGEGVETISPEDALDGSLNGAIRRIDDEKGGDRSIRPFI